MLGLVNFDSGLLMIGLLCLLLHWLCIFGCFAGLVVAWVWFVWVLSARFVCVAGCSVLVVWLCFDLRVGVDCFALLLVWFLCF